jgi:hypothetical protein
MLHSFGTTVALARVDSHAHAAQEIALRGLGKESRNERLHRE